MSTAQRRIDPGVVQQLIAEPHRFGFFQAMRILEHMFQRQGAGAGDVLPRRVRFRNTLSLAFPASELESVRAYSIQGDVLDSAAALNHAIETEGIGEVHVTPAFMGLLGVSGALPLHYTEMLGEREIYQRDRTPRAFLDIFTNRAVALHYAAWKKYRLGLRYELERRERFLPLLLSLSGMGLPGLHDRMVDGKGDVFDQAVAFYSGAIRQRPVSAVLLQRVLSDYFGVPVRVEQFVGAWYEVPQHQATRLGLANARLGSTALAGRRIWQGDLRLCLHVGPLSRGDFDAFLPGGSAARALAKWLMLLTGSCLEYEARLVLRAQDVRQAGVGEANGVRLGWDSFLCTRPARAPRADASYGIRTLQ